MRKRPIQLEFPPRGRGGRRPGAGRPGGDRITHHGRPKLPSPLPVHVSFHVLDDLPNLRRKDIFRAIRGSIHDRKQLEGFRITHWSVQSNHGHLLVEADDQVTLSHAMQCLNTSIAKRLNRRAARHGPVLDDRYYEHPLRTPREVRNAIIYVVRNRQHHTGIPGMDFCSSECHPWAVAEPRTWLLAVGWRGGERRAGSG